MSIPFFPSLILSSPLNTGGLFLLFDFIISAFSLFSCLLSFCPERPTRPKNPLYHRKALLGDAVVAASAPLDSYHELTPFAFASSFASSATAFAITARRALPSGVVG